MSKDLIDICGKKRLTIMITSAGGLTGIFLCKHYRQNGAYRIVAVDMSELNPIKKWVDAFYIVPAVNDKKYISAIQSIILKEKIDVIIPVTSYDVDLYSLEMIQCQIFNVKMLLIGHDDQTMLSNKLSCYNYLSSIGINTPHVYKTINELDFPCILKPVIGTGSKNTMKIDNMIDYNYWSGKIVDHMLVEYIEGPEFTVDCLFDKTGKSIGANVRERVKTVSGGVTVSRNAINMNIDYIIKILENTNKMRGPVNFQFKKSKNGECCLFDFNTRLASGGLPLTVRSGFDIPNKLVELILDKEVSQWHPQASNDKLIMIRYYEEYYEKMI